MTTPSVTGAARAPGHDRIAAAFSGHGNRAALMPYLMGGFPDPETSRAIGTACVENGADLLEVGIPYSDPLADGPVIHDAGTKALQSGATTAGVLDVMGDLAELCPVVCMCYANLVYARGAERFAAALAARGIAGLIVPDLPLEETDEVAQAADAHGVALVPLVAPTTPPERLRAIGARARGFVYTVSVSGTTGERTGTSGSVAGPPRPGEGGDGGAGRPRLRHRDARRRRGRGRRRRGRRHRRLPPGPRRGRGRAPPGRPRGGRRAGRRAGSGPAIRSRA